MPCVGMYKRRLALRKIEVLSKGVLESLQVMFLSCQAVRSILLAINSRNSILWKKILQEITAAVCVLPKNQECAITHYKTAQLSAYPCSYKLARVGLCCENCNKKSRCMWPIKNLDNSVVYSSVQNLTKLITNVI